MEQEYIQGAGSFNVVVERELLTPNTVIIAGSHLKSDVYFNKYLTGKSFYLHYIKSTTRGNVLNRMLIKALQEANVIIAIGGGGILDFAKVMLHQYGKERAPLFVAVPTTAGSGSEATPFAVIYEEGVKRSLEDDLLLPDLVILDPLFQTSISPLQLSISGADAIAQCIESIWNVKATEDSTRYAQEALTILLKQLPMVMTKYEESRIEQLLYGSYLAGRAIALTHTTGPHALSYYLTIHHSVPHGEAVALFLPLFFIYNTIYCTQERCVHPKGIIGVAKSMENLYQVLQVKNAENAFQKIHHFYQQFPLRTRLYQMGVRQEELDSLLASINVERFNNNPVQFDASVLKPLILKYCY